MKKGEYVSQTSRTRFILPSECTFNTHTVIQLKRSSLSSTQSIQLAMHALNLLYYSERTDI